MSGPIPPDPVLANAAAVLEKQLLAFDGALARQPFFNASSADGGITAEASAAGDLVSLTISAALLTPAVNVLTAIVRDFRDTHPDFEAAISGLVTDLVQSTLGPDGKPIFAGPNGRGSITSAETFQQWFTDVPDVNQALRLPLELRETTPGSGIFSFESSAFFPIDGQLLGNQGRAHNYHFTLEVHTTFTYQGGEVFQFTSDDDLWVFIDRRLVLDLGGTHAPETGAVALDALGLTRGQTYALDLFFAERHTVGSHLQLQIGIAAGQGLPAVVIPVINAAIAEGRAKARSDLAALAAGFSLPGLSAEPPVLPDIPGFGEAVTSFQHQMRALEAAAATASYVGRAADGKVEVTVNGLLDVTAMTLDPSLFSSADAPATAGFIQQALDLALRSARHDDACQEIDAAIAAVAREAVIVYAGYLDNEHGTRNEADTPTPFDPDANTILISTGGVDTRHDTGVIRFENRTDGPVTIDRGLQVGFQIWDRVDLPIPLPLTLEPGQNLVLAETENFNFDTSDTGFGIAPVVSGSVNGRAFAFVDEARVLLGREDAGKDNGNETTAYRELGRIAVPAHTMRVSK